MPLPPPAPEAGGELGEVKTTARGFELIEFLDCYDKPCSLQQSSLAIYATPGISAIWLGQGDDRMHLKENQVEALITHLQRWLDDGSFRPAVPLSPAKAVITVDELADVIRGDTLHPVAHGFTPEDITQHLLTHPATAAFFTSFSPCHATQLAPEAGERLAPRVLAMCKQREWSLHWTSRGAYLHLEVSELIEALRGKRGDPTAEAADVLLVLMSITENAGIAWSDVVQQTAATCSRLEACDQYPGEERMDSPAALNAEPVGEGPSDELVDDLFNRFADSCDEYGLWSMGKDGPGGALAYWGRPATPPAPEPVATRQAGQGPRLRDELGVAMAGLPKNAIIEALLAGTLHDAVCIDWSLVQ